MQCINEKFTCDTPLTTCHMADDCQTFGTDFAKDGV